MQLTHSVYVAGRRGACKGGELGMRSAGWMGQAMAVKASGLQQSGRQGPPGGPLPAPTRHPPAHHGLFPGSCSSPLCSPHSAQARWFPSSLFHVAVPPCPPGSLPPRPHGSAESWGASLSSCPGLAFSGIPMSCRTSTHSCFPGPSNSPAPTTQNFEMREGSYL